MILELWAKMLAANQIAGFFKMSYLKKEVNYEVYFWHTYKHQSLLQVDSIFWVCVTKYVQSNQNKLTISLQYLKENVKGEVQFLPADKRQIFLQISTIILGVCCQACPNYLK